MAEFRRGLATNLHQLGVADKDIQAILRHSNVGSHDERLPQERRRVASRRDGYLRRASRKINLQRSCNGRERVGQLKMRNALVRNGITGAEGRD